MSKIPYLFRRGNVFYFRLAVPVELRDKFQCREVVQSLKTEKRSDAVPLALGLAADVTKLFNDAKTMKDMAHKRQIAALRAKLDIKDRLHREEVEQRELEHLAAIKRAKSESTLKAENDTLREIVARGVGKHVGAETTTAKEQSR